MLDYSVHPQGYGSRNRCNTSSRDDAKVISLWGPYALSYSLLGTSSRCSTSYLPTTFVPIA